MSYIIQRTLCKRHYRIYIVLVLLCGEQKRFKYAKSGCVLSWKKRRKSTFVKIPSITLTQRCYTCWHDYHLLASSNIQHWLVPPEEWVAPQGLPETLASYYKWTVDRQYHDVLVFFHLWQLPSISKSIRLHDGDENIEKRYFFLKTWVQTWQIWVQQNASTFDKLSKLKFARIKCKFTWKFRYLRHVVVS